ncbi:hypothetical protein I4U23_023782 [Adineta vaga]|nr:hypothetical protein I4U23_023782 [Adineta vaga]
MRTQKGAIHFKSDMGHKQSTRRKQQQVVEDVIIDRDQNTTQSVDCLSKVKRIPMKYFGGQAIENDASMHKMHQDLLSFDDKVKQGCSPRKKRRRSKKQTNIDEYESQDEQYYDQNPQVISDDENYSSHIYVNVNPPTDYSTFSWLCRYCDAENQLTTIKCYQCGEMENRF